MNSSLTDRSGSKKPEMAIAAVVTLLYLAIAFHPWGLRARALEGDSSA